MRSRRYLQVSNECTRLVPLTRCCGMASLDAVSWNEFSRHDSEHYHVSAGRGTAVPEAFAVA